MPERLPGSREDRSASRVVLAVTWKFAREDAALHAACDLLAYEVQFQRKRGDFLDVEVEPQRQVRRLRRCVDGLPCNGKVSCANTT